MINYTLSKKNIIRSTVLALFILSIAIFVRLEFYTSSQKSFSGPVGTLRLGAETGLLASTVWIAEHNGYFNDQGLDVQIKEFPSGRSALASMLGDGNLDMVTVAQTSVVSSSFSRNDFQIIAGMVSSYNDVKILGRKDKNINTGADLKGKKIGVTHGSTGHYFLGLFLAQHNLELHDVVTVDMEASALPQAIINASVDAISSWEPHIYKTRIDLGSNALQLESKDVFREDFYFAVFKDWAKNNPKLMERFLLAIDQAETYIKQNTEQAQYIVAQRLRLNETLVAALWKDYSFELFLDQAIPLTFEQQARWMIENKIVDKKEPSNYLDFIYVDALEEVRPETVTIIR